MDQQPVPSTSAEARAVPITVTPLARGIAADISGVDLSQPLHPDTIAAIREAWLTHMVVRFRGQQLSRDQLLAFSRHFGKLDRAPINTRGRNWIDGYPELAVMSNIKVDGEPVGSLGFGEAVWHTDMSYQDITPSAALLYGIEVTTEGGETGFMNMAAALANMPADLRAQIEGRSIKHDASYNSAGHLRKGFQPVTDPSVSPGAVHPAIIRHPETGQQALFLGRRPNAYVMGLPVPESEALLDRLWAHCHAQTDLWYQKWQVGDLVMWDNRCTMHRRTAFEESARRYLLRTTVVSGRPSA